MGIRKTMIYFITKSISFDLSRDIQMSDMEELLQWLQNKAIISVDSETSGLSWQEKKIIMFQVGNKDTQWVIDARSISLMPMKRIFESREVLKIFHNAKFDYHFLREAGIMLWNVYDTFLAEMVLYNGYKGKGYSLEALVSRYFSESMDKTERNKTIDLGSAPFSERLIRYGSKDIEFLEEIMQRQLWKAGEDELEKVVWLENEAVLALADIEHNGMHLNREKWLEVAHTSQDRVSEYQGRLDYILLTDDTFKRFRPEHIQSDMFLPQEELRKIEVNWDSPSQVLEIIHSVLPGVPDTNANTLEKYTVIPVIEELLRYREFQKEVSTYGPNFVENIHSGTGRIHTQFRQILVSGRSASNNVNMQNLPADNKFRNSFEPGIKDWVFVSGDYSAAELTVIAVKSKDAVWTECLRKSEDLHSLCAGLIYGQKWEETTEKDCAYVKAKQKCRCKGHKVLRQNVKTISFGLSYGMTEKKLAQRLNISEREALRLLNTYFDTFPRIKDFLLILAAYGRENGKIKTFMPYKRVRYFPEWRKEMLENYDHYKKQLGEIERESRNHPIQGSIGDCMKKALYMILLEIYDNSLPVKLVMQVHDSIDTICHKDYAEEWAKKLKELMELAALEIVPEGLLKADVGISEVWTKD